MQGLDDETGDKSGVFPKLDGKAFISPVPFLSTPVTTAIERTGARLLNYHFDNH